MFPDEQKTKARICFKTSTKTSKQSAKQSVEILKSLVKTKAESSCIKTLVTCLSYNKWLSYVFFQLKHSSILVILLFSVSLLCIYVSNC